MNRWKRGHKVSFLVDKEMLFFPHCAAPHCSFFLTLFLSLSLPIPKLRGYSKSCSSNLGVAVFLQLTQEYQMLLQLYLYSLPQACWGFTDVMQLQLVRSLGWRAVCSGSSSLGSTDKFCICSKLVIMCMKCIIQHEREKDQRQNLKLNWLYFGFNSCGSFLTLCFHAREQLHKWFGKVSFFTKKYCA